MSKISIKNLTKTYKGNVEAVRDINIEIEIAQKFPNKIALGLDAKDGYLSVSGWKAGRFKSSNKFPLSIRFVTRPIRFDGSLVVVGK